MTQEQLYQTLIEQLIVIEIHPLYKAIIEECCENAINNQKKITDKETLIYATQIAFTTALSIFKATMKSALDLNDQVTIHYRNQIFIIPRGSRLID